MPTTDQPVTSTCDFCGRTFTAHRTPIGPGPFTALTYPAGAGSDHLATWCADCGPRHRGTTPIDRPWNGETDALIHGHTNPWIRDPHGADVDLAERFGHFPTATDSPCGECGPLPGTLAPMDTHRGIQRCDACDLYPGDLDAAAALAASLGTGYTVWFHGTTGTRS